MNLDVYMTHMELYPYKQDDYPAIEDMFMAIDKMSGLHYACGFMIEDGKLYLPRGASISRIEHITGCKVTYINEYDEYDDMMRRYYPRYEPRNKLQEDSIEFLCEDSPQLSLNLKMGWGKAVTNTTAIPTPTGYKLMGDMKPGDRIFGSDGEVYTVLGVFPQGVKKIYKVTFADGRISRCCEEHLWAVYDSERQYVLQLKDMLKNYKENIKVADHFVSKYRYSIPLLTSPVQYEHRDVSVDPYTVGVFLSSGLYKEKRLCIEGSADVIRKVCDNNGYKSVFDSKKWRHYFRIEDRHIYVESKDYFEDLEGFLKQDDCTKEIPECYMINDDHIRLEFIRGLFDAGSCLRIGVDHYCVHYTSKSLTLINQLQEMLWGMGYLVKTYLQFDEEDDDYYAELVVDAASQQKIAKLFSDVRYKEKLFSSETKYNIFKNNTTLDIINIEEDGEEEATCIMVDSPDHLFLTQDFIVTHNTFCVGYSCAKLQEKIIVITPNDGLKQQWIKTFHQMIGIPDERLINITGSPFMEGIMMGKVEPGDAYFVNHQTLRSYLTNNGGYALHQFFKKIKVAIKVYDECHMEFGNILLVDFFSNTKRTWYLTATFARTDKSELECYKRAFSSVANFGYQESVELEEKHVVYHIVNINSHIDMKNRYKMMKYPGFTAPRYGQYAIFDDPNNTLYRAIVMILEKCKDVEGKVLIFIPLIDAVDHVVEKLRKDIVGKSIAAYHSKISKSEKEEAEQKDIIVSTIKSCGTGRDIKGLRVVINAEPVASKVIIEQTIGRLRPYGEGKNTFFFDIVDRSLQPVCWWFRARFKKIETLVKEVIDLDIETPKEISEFDELDEDETDD